MQCECSKLQLRIHGRTRPSASHLPFAGLHISLLLNFGELVALLFSFCFAGAIEGMVPAADDASAVRGAYRSKRQGCCKTIPETFAADPRMAQVAFSNHTGCLTLAIYHMRLIQDLHPVAMQLRFRNFWMCKRATTVGFFWKTLFQHPL